MTIQYHITIEGNVPPGPTDQDEYAEGLRQLLAAQLKSFTGFVTGNRFNLVNVIRDGAPSDENQ